MTSAIGCSFWSARLSFTNPVTVRHFCLLGHNRYAAPITFGVCNDHDPSNGSFCRECMSWDGTQKRECNYLKGHPPEIGMVPPAAGYDDTNCPIGYEKYMDVTFLDLQCPLDSVLVLEILPATPSLSLQPDSNGTLSLVSNNPLYDFAITTPKEVVREFEAHQCLTGNGGRDCGDKPLTMLGYHQEGHCQLGFHSGTGYQIDCDNGLQPESSMAEDQAKHCFAKNGFNCLEVMQLSSASASSKPNVVVLNGQDEEDDDFPNGLCGLDEAQGLANPVAWLVGAAAVLLTLLPSFSYWRKGNISPAFLVGLLCEAMKNGLVMASIISVDWSCLEQYGLIIPTGKHSIFFFFCLIAFSLTDTVLLLVAVLFRWGQDLEDTLDKFKWVAWDEDGNNNQYNPGVRRVMTFSTMLIFGGLGGFMQLALVLEGTVDNPEDTAGEALSVWASWIYIISASLGALFGVLLMIVGVKTGKMRLAWKTYKILVGDVPGLVTAVDLAVVLSVGWLGETFADFVHIMLYVPPLLISPKQAPLASEMDADTEEPEAPQQY